MKNSDNKKNRKVGCLCGLVIIIAVFAIMIALVSGSDEPSDKTTTGKAQTTVSESKTNNEQPVIYEDNYIKASFVRVYDEASIQGAAYMQLHVENKSDKTYTVAMTKATINGMTTTIGSGVPMKILPGNASEQPFILFTNNTGVNSADDINKVQFSFLLMDENTNTIEETKSITVNVK